MKRLNSAVLMVAVCFVICGAFSPTLAAKPTEITQKPNILWIYIEDMSPWIGCWGDAINKNATPTIDALAAGGVRFTRCYVPAPVCSPCRSALITGAYQTTTGLHNHRSSRSKEGAIYLPEGVTTLPQLFRKAGYQTFNAGKDDYNFVYDRKNLYEETGKNKFAAWRSLSKTGKPFFGQIQLSGGKSNTKSVKNKVDPAAMTRRPITRIPTSSSSSRPTTTTRSARPTRTRRSSWTISRPMD